MKGVMQQIMSEGPVTLDELRMATSKAQARKPDL